MLKVGLHNHSEWSHDGRDPVEDLLARARRAGLDAFAVTDHDNIEGSLEAVRRAPEYGLVGIPGLEISSADGHVLAFGITETVPPGLPFSDTVDRIHKLGGIAVVPHPFQESRHGVLANISRDELAIADAIEVYNSRLLTGRANRQAERVARERGLPMTAGSDAHISEMVGRAITNVAAETRDVESILEAIRQGHTTVEGRRTPWHISIRQAVGGVRRRVAERLGRLRR
ncbi:MAG: PHP domain-containing protein [Halovenus sp.]